MPGLLAYYHSVLGANHCPSVTWCHGSHSAIHHLDGYCEHRKGQQGQPLSNSQSQYKLLSKWGDCAAFNLSMTS